MFSKKHSNHDSADNGRESEISLLVYQSVIQCKDKIHNQ